MFIPIFRAGVEVEQLPVDENTMYYNALMGEHKITSNFVWPERLNIQVNDYIQYRAENFTINTVPNIRRTHTFEHSLIFEGIRYRLYDKVLRVLGRSDFPFYGDALQALQLIVDNINEIDSGWAVGTVDPTEPQHLRIEKNTSCRVALTNFAQAFGMEWHLTGKTIHLTKQAGNILPYTFEYGQGKGLYELTREAVQDKNVVTRFYGMGGTRNVPKNYRDGLGRITFDELFIDVNRQIYGIKEVDFIAEDIFPSREGTVSAVGNFDPNSEIFAISDSTLEFNVKDAIEPGLDGKVSFKTGELAGVEFVINNYDAASKTLFLIKDKDSQANITPNEAFQAAVGDKYTFLDINLPESYITDAEARVKARTQEFATENGVPRVAYGLLPDLLHFRDHNIFLNPGDKATVKDTVLGVDKLIRINNVSHSLTFPFVITKQTKYNVTLADFVAYDVQDRIKADIVETQKAIRLVSVTNAELARRNTIQNRDLKSLIFNPDGGLTEIMKAGIAEIGFDSQNFNLNNVIFEPNVGGNPNVLSISGGELIHYEYEIENIGFVWQITGRQFTNLDPLKNYYVYARCSSSSPLGTWELSENEVYVDSEPGYYNFNLGVLYRVLDGWRGHDFTNGITFIVGDTIKTGRIKSIDGLNYFDLTQNSFKLGNEASGISWNVEKPGALVVRGEVYVTGGNAATNDSVILQINEAYQEQVNYINGIRDSLQNQIDGVQTAYFENFDPTINNYPASSWDPATYPEHENDTFTNDGTGASWRWKQTAGVWGWVEITDTVALQALQAASQAQDTADGKRRTFLNQPFTPYQRGDIWFTGGAILSSNTDRASGDFIASDWTKKDNYQNPAEVQAVADDALEAAAGYTDATAELKRQQAEAYADGIVTLEEQARINQAAANLQAAKDFATSAANAAQSAASDLANAAQSAANTANNLAQTANQSAQTAANAAQQAQDAAGTANQAAADAYAQATQAQADADAAAAAAAAAEAEAIQAAADAAQAAAQAVNAQNTANRAAGITDFLFTTIDNNVVATGTLLVGDVGGVNNAGITGVTDNGANSVRFWAGSNFAGRNSAPFRVQNNGKVFLTNAVVSGEINAQTGTIGGFSIGANKIFFADSFNQFELNSGGDQGLSVNRITIKRFTGGVWADVFNVSSFGDIKGNSIVAAGQMTKSKLAGLTLDLSRPSVVIDHAEFRLEKCLGSGMPYNGGEHSGQVRIFVSGGRRYLVLEGG